MIFAFIQAALWFYGREVALQAARDGVSQLRLQQTFEACEASKPGIDQAVRAYAKKVGSGALTVAGVTPTCQYNANGGSTVEVEVQGSAISLIGISWNITETATGTVEQFQTGG